MQQQVLKKIDKNPQKQQSLSAKKVFEQYNKVEIDESKNPELFKKDFQSQLIKNEQDHQQINEQQLTHIQKQKLRQIQIKKQMLSQDGTTDINNHQKSLQQQENTPKKGSLKENKTKQNVNNQYLSFWFDSEQNKMRLQKKIFTKIQGKDFELQKLHARNYTPDAYNQQRELKKQEIQQKQIFQPTFKQREGLHSKMQNLPLIKVQNQVQQSKCFTDDAKNKQFFSDNNNQYQENILDKKYFLKKDKKQFSISKSNLYKTLNNMSIKKNNSSSSLLKDSIQNDDVNNDKNNKIDYKKNIYRIKKSSIFSKENSQNNEKQNNQDQNFDDLEEEQQNLNLVKKRSSTLNDISQFEYQKLRQTQYSIQRQNFNKSVNINSNNNLNKKQQNKSIFSQKYLQ